MTGVATCGRDRPICPTGGRRATITNNSLSALCSSLPFRNLTQAFVYFQVKCSSEIQYPVQELTENGNIVTTAGEDDKSPDVMTELLPV